jgi:hypothetical protein
MASSGLTQFLFVARVAFDLAFKGLAKAVVISHPSLLQIPDDFKASLPDLSCDVCCPYNGL